MGFWSSLRAFRLFPVLIFRYGAGMRKTIRSAGTFGVMLVSNHVLSGAAIGAAARGPGQAFALGVASHFALDAVPHWGDWRDHEHFMHVAVRDGITGLALMGALTAIAPRGRRLTVLAAMAGAALPDADKPCRLVFGWSPWPEIINRFHAGIQQESQRRAPVEVAAGTLFGSAALAGLIRRRQG